MAEARCRHSSGLPGGPAARSGPSEVTLAAVRALAVSVHSCGRSVSPWPCARSWGLIAGLQLEGWLQVPSWMLLRQVSPVK